MSFWSIFFIGFGAGTFATALTGFVLLVVSDDVSVDDADEHAQAGIG